MEKREGNILFFPHRCVDPETGYVKACREDLAVNIEPVRVFAGTKLRWLDKNAPGRVFFYGTEINEKWVHTFCYERESNWAPYDRERAEAAYSCADRIFERDGFIRIVIRFAMEADGKDPEKETRLCTERVQAAFVLEDPAEALAGQAQIRPYFREEAQRVSKKLAAVREPGDLVFFLMGDTHYTVNGIWEDSAENVKYMAELCRPDFAVHLGDLTDGLLPGVLTEQYTGRVLDVLQEAAGKVYCCLGNHDSNYAGGNPERFTKEEAVALYLERYAGGRDMPCAGRTAAADLSEPKEFYYTDCAEQQLRCIFLASFDSERATENDRYGYADEECEWLSGVLRDTPEGYGVLVFSHVPLLPEMHVWSDGIRGSEKVRQILESFQAERNAILACFHGHNHCDQIETKLSFPIVSVGCSKLESFPEKKPAGAVCYEREKGTVTQDLWDVVRVSRDHGTVDLIRFGAGEDRRIQKRTK